MAKDSAPEQVVAEQRSVVVDAPRPSHRSITPGSSVDVTILNAVGTVSSVTWDPATPLEYGRTVST